MKILNNLVFLIIFLIVIFAAGFAFGDCPACGATDEASRAYDHEKAEHGGNGEKISQTTCPVMGGEIDKNVYVDHDGKRVYLCCEACVKAFQEDPDKYLDKLKAEGVELEDAPIEQTACPVSGKAINTAIFTDHEGERVYFCCNGCKASFEKDPAKYMKKS